ncbi:MAG: bifunctional DNA primase/polymerase [Candidatus Latescibacterota bacterium]|nr:MAG: bifunctional DNA primase/polymerase [Candidatus Latescibacterota bacterium]
MLEEALRLVRAGISVIPIRTDGSKGPAMESWAPYVQRLPTEEELREWFNPDRRELGIAHICGMVSGGTFVIDFEDKDTFRLWASHAKDAVPDWVEKTCTVETPRGYHVHLKIGFEKPGEKLALIPQKRKKGEEVEIVGYAIIESRGQGQYAILPGSPAECHPTQMRYEYVEGDLAELEAIDREDFEILLQIARSFTTYKPESKGLKRGAIKEIPKDDQRPGTDYCLRGSWPELLERHGWTLLRKHPGGKEIWKRPGKTDRGGSATLGFVLTELGQELYVFSCNAAPLEEGRCYNLFAARALLDFEGDFKKTIEAVIAEGYGKSASEHYLKLTKTAIDIVRDKIARGDELFPEIMQSAFSGDAKFQRVWQKRRADFGTSWSRYDGSLLWYAQTHGVQGHQIEIGVGMVYAWRKKHSLSVEPALDINYIARKVQFLAENASKSEDEAVESLEFEARGDDSNNHVKAAQEYIHPDFRGIKQYGGDATATFLVTWAGDYTTRISSIHDLCTAQTFWEAALTTVPSFTGFASPLCFKPQVWRNNIIPSLKVIIVELGIEGVEITEDNQTMETLFDYLASVTIYTEGGERESWDQGLINNDPIQRNGAIAINLMSFIRWADKSRGIKIKRHRTWPILRERGFRKCTITGTPSGKKEQAKYWEVSLKILNEQRKSLAFDQLEEQANVPF